MIKMGFARRLTAVVANLSLLLNSFLPFILAIQPVYAQNSETVVSTIQYDSSNNKLNITTDGSEKIAYQLFFKTDQKIDAIAGNDLNQANQSESFYLGTCSSNSVCLSQDISRGVLKIESNSKFYSKFFTLKNNTLTVVKEIESPQSDLTEEENNFLENKQSSTSNWTFEKVELNKEYVAPQNSGVKLIFTKLPEPSGNIKIEEIILTPEQIEQTGALSDKAYDITSDMADGTFVYNLSLPIPESASGQGVDIKFAETVFEIDSAQKVDEIIKIDDTVLAQNLDHFTVFFAVVKTTDKNLVEKEIFKKGETVYINTLVLDLSKTRIVIKNPNGDIVKQFNDTYSPAYQYTYTVLQNNPIGEYSLNIGSYQIIGGSFWRGYQWDWVWENNVDTFTVESVCGDEFKDADEQCDDGNQNGQQCVPEYNSVCNYCSNKCKTITIDNLDRIAPEKPTGLKRITKDESKEFLCGDFAKRQTLIPTWDDMSIGDSSFDHYEYVSFNPNGSVGTTKNLTINKFDHNWVPTTDGTNGYSVRSVDKAGNTSDWALSSKTLEGSCQIVYDSTAPSKPVFTSPTTNITNINAITLKWDGGDDAGSGVKGYIFRYVFNPINGSNPINWSSGFVQTTSKTRSGTFGHGQGTYTMFVKTIDNVGNESAESDPFVITYDATSPTSSIFIQGDLDESKNIAGNTRWFKSFDNIDLKINTGDQSLDKINYQILSGESVICSNQILDYTSVVNGTNLASIVNSKTDGIYSLCYFASDLAGNKETIHKEILKKDSTIPSFSIGNISGNKIDGVFYNRNDISFDLTINDPSSGYSHARYDLYNADVNHNCTTLIGSNQNNAVSIDNPVTRTLSKTGLSDGNYCFRVWTYDRVQNKAWTDSSGNNGWIKFTIDNTSPTSTITGGENNSVIYSPSWDGSVLGTASDTLSGVDQVKISIKKGDKYFDGTDFTKDSELLLDTNYSTGNWDYTGLILPKEGSYTIKSHAIDNAGNQENTYTLTIVLDKTISEVGISLNPTAPDASNGWYKTQPEVTLTHTDVNFDKIQYQWGSQSDSGWNTYLEPFKLTTEGAHVLYYRAIDKATNISPIGVKNIKWDKTELELGPQNISANPNPTSGSTSKISWEKAKDNDGIDHYEVQWNLNDSTNPLSYSKTVDGNIYEVEIDKLTEGRWTVKVIAFDASGKSKDNSIDLIVDRTGPSAPNLNLTGTGTGTASLSWNTINDAKDYIVWYGNTPGTYVYGARVGNVTSYTVQGLGAGNYYFVVKAVDAAQNQSGNSNEVNTGTIAGAIGIEPNQPAQGFASEVLGTDDTKEDNPEITPVSSGEVLGTSLNDDGLNWWWLLLLLIPVSYIGYKFVKRKE